MWGCRQVLGHAGIFWVASASLIAAWFTTWFITTVVVLLGPPASPRFSGAVVTVHTYVSKHIYEARFC